MNKQHIIGAFQETKGQIKDGWGRLFKNRKLQAKGKADKLKGKSRKLAGDVKDAF